MEIGIVTVRELDYNPNDVEDVKRAAAELGVRTSPFYLDSASIYMGKGIGIFMWTSHSERVTPSFTAAFFRHIGSPRSIDEYLFRIWVLKAMEASGIYVSNPIDAWSTAHNKIGALTMLAHHGVPVPPSKTSEDPVILYRESQELKRIVAKPSGGYMGLGVMVFESPDEAVPYYVHAHNTSTIIMVQTYLEGARTGDYRVIVVGDEAVGAIKRYGESKHNVAQGARVEPVKADGELAETAIKAVNVLGLDFAGVDLVEDEGTYFVTDVNPTFSWQGFKRATGLNPAIHILRHILVKARR